MHDANQRNVLLYGVGKGKEELTKTASILRIVKGLKTSKLTKYGFLGQKASQRSRKTVWEKIKHRCN